MISAHKVPLWEKLSNLKKVDLTHTVDSNCPTWTGEIGINLSREEDVQLKDKYRLRIYYLHLTQNIGTHIDSPSHLVDDGITVSKIDLNHLVNIPIYIINVIEKVKSNVDYQLSLDDINDFEKKHGEIGPGSLVVCYSGWDQYWNDKKKYSGTDNNDMHFPVFSMEAVKFLTENRLINGIGIDTFSPEIHQDLPIHCYILGKGKYIVENLTNLGSMPACGGIVSVLPMKCAELSEAPVRVVGFYSDDDLNN